MHVDNFNLAAYSFLLATLGYGAFAVQLTKSAAVQPHFGRAGLLFLFSVLSTALWAGCALWIEVRSSTASARLATAALDWLRYGLWFAFLIQLLSVQPLRGRATQAQWLAVTATMLMVLALIALPSSLNASQEAPETGKWFYFLALAQAVLGLLLVEQLFRNLAEDSRWNAKPLCLGLICIFGFDVYLYSYGALFGRLDLDAAQIRSAVHTLAVPLLFVAASRRADWLTKIQVSRAAVFHSATLLLVGGYLLFISFVLSAANGGGRCSWASWWWRWFFCCCLPCPAQRGPSCGCGWANTFSATATTTASSGCASRTPCQPNVHRMRLAVW
jgi:hypothetical protein